MEIQDEEWAEYCRRFIELKKDCERDFSESELRRLRCFNLNPDVYRAVSARDMSRLPGLRHLDRCTNISEFCDSIDVLLDYEELSRAISLRKFDQFSRRLNLKYGGELGGRKSYGVKVPLLGASSPFDLVILRDQSLTWTKLARIRVADDYVTLLDTSRPDDCKHLDGVLNLSFVWSGIPVAACHQAIAALRDNWTMQMIVTDYCLSFDSQLDKVDLGNTDTPELRRRLAELDSCQRQAVVAILKARCRPRAYILTGPPGSGKSRVIVESVVQAYKRTRMSILVCVTSNHFADSLYEKLTKALPEADDIRRLRAGDNLDFKISSEKLLVTTNSKSHSLRHKHLKFDYVFMDEANHANLTESFVPLRLLKSTGCFVLCGDPKQLNPLEYWKEAGEFGLNSSLLDKLLQFKIYQVGNDNSGDHITKLVRSHRCDERILATSNELFYNQEAKCLTQTPKSILNLMRLTGPVQFVPVTLDSIQEAAVPYSNEKEADCVVDLIIKLYKVGFEPEQIGVISPYKLQTKLIATKLANAIRAVSAMLEDRFPPQSSDNSTRLVGQLESRDWSCKIDSVAGYQGDERDIIILSTVETSTELGSLEHEGRFNVAVSRAKWLMLVVGCPTALRSGTLWPRLLDHAIEGELGRWLMNFERSSQGAASLTQSLQGLSLIDLWRALFFSVTMSAPRRDCTSR